MENNILLDSVDIDAIEKMSGKDPTARALARARDDAFFEDSNPWMAVRQWMAKGIYDGYDPNTCFVGWGELLECLSQPLDRDNYLLTLSDIYAKGQMPEICSRAFLNVLDDIIQAVPKTYTVEERKQLVYGLMYFFKRMDQNVDDETPAVTVAHALNLEINRLLPALHEAQEPRLL